MRTLETEMAAHKYAHVERERRWLVDRDRRPDLASAPHVLIEDRYIEGTRLRLRRMTDAATGAQSLKLSKKYEAPDPCARPVVTSYLTQAEFALFAGLPARPLVKRRYEIVEDGLTFGIDLFDGALAGLETAEVEIDNDAGLRAVAPPAWALRDVSHDPAYQGGHLAHHGIPKE